jgi:hypothetical protein
VGKHWYVELSRSEDEWLRAIEHSPYLNRKVRLPGQRVRLPFQGWEMNRTGYVGCHVRTVGAALDAWEARGVEGLADLPQKGNGRKRGAEVLKLLQLVEASAILLTVQAAPCSRPTCERECRYNPPLARAPLEAFSPSGHKNRF